MSETQSQFASGTTTTTSRTKGVLSLVFGIVSIPLSLIFAILGVLLGVTAVILGVLSRRSEPGARKLALAGIITGSIGMVLNIASMILGAVIVAQYMQ